MPRNRPSPTWRVTAHRFRQLLKDVRQGKRVYELLLIARPRDLIPYLDIVVTSGWDVVAEHAERWDSTVYNARKMTAANGLLMKPVPYGKFLDFTENFELGHTWLRRVRGKPFRKFITKLIALAQRQATCLHSNQDPLIQVDIDAFDKGTHPSDQAYLESGGSANVPKFVPMGNHYIPPTWRVTAPRLQTLINDTQQGCRIYEVLQITRPRDLIPYLDIVVTSGGDVLAKHAKWQVKDQAEAKRLLEKSHHYAHFVQFIGNSELGNFWLARVRGNPFRKFIRKLMALVQRQAICLRASSDSLIQVDVRAFDKGTHQWDQAWLELAGACYPKSPHFHRYYSEAFYYALEHLLALPAINSFAHLVVTNGDYQTLRLACLEQRRRGGPQVFSVHGSYDYPPFDHGMEFDNEAYRVVFPNIPQWFYEASTSHIASGRYDLRLTDKPVPDAYIKTRKLLLYSFVSERSVTAFCGFNHPNGWSVHIRNEFPDLAQEILVLFPDLIPLP